MSERYVLDDTRKRDPVVTEEGSTLAIVTVHTNACANREDARALAEHIANFMTQMRFWS